jgi:hypothetical protein
LRFFILSPFWFLKNFVSLFWSDNGSLHFETTVLCLLRYVFTPGVSRKNQYLLSLVFGGKPAFDGSIAPGGMPSIADTAMLAKRNKATAVNDKHPETTGKYSMGIFTVQPILRKCNEDVIIASSFHGMHII